MEQKLDIEHRLTAVEDRSKSNTKRLDKPVMAGQTWAAF